MASITFRTDAASRRMPTAFSTRASDSGNASSGSTLSGSILYTAVITTRSAWFWARTVAAVSAAGAEGKPRSMRLEQGSRVRGSRQYTR